MMFPALYHVHGNHLLPVLFISNSRIVTQNINPLKYILCDLEHVPLYQS